MPPLAPLIVLLAVLALPTPQPTFPGEARPTPTGPVWVEMVSAVGKGPREGIGRGLIDAPPERVWRALTDYAHWQEFMPFLKRSDARPQHDGSVLGQHVMDLPSPLGERHYQVRFTQRIETGAEGRVWRIQWVFVPGSGNVADHRGSWTLTALGSGRTLAVCRLFTDPGGWTPRWSVDRGTSQMLPWIFHGLRQHVRRSRYDGP